MLFFREEFLVMILPSPQLIVMSLANKDLQDEERSALAIALNNLKGQWGGGEFEVQESTDQGRGLPRLISLGLKSCQMSPHLSL